MTGEAVKEVIFLQKRIDELENPLYMDKRPSMHRVKTLEALVSYLFDNHDGVNIQDCTIIVEDIDRVTVYAPVSGVKNDRHPLITASPVEFAKLSTGIDLTQEEMIIQLQALCIRTDETINLIHAISGLTYVEKVNSEDDGVKTDLNIALHITCTNKKPESIITLQPYRIFPEVRQPESQMLVRISSRNKVPVVKLIEVDGGMWKIQAMKNIKDHLKELVWTAFGSDKALTKCPVTVIS